MLYLKCYTTTLHELRVTTEGKDGEGKVLPANEKTVRLRRLSTELPGVQFEGVYEPSARLIDVAYQGVQALAIPYIPWSACTSRIDESKGNQRASLTNEVVQWVADAQGVLREKPHTVKPVADLSSDLKVYMALHRRGIALHVAGAITFTAHRQLVDKLILMYLSDPPVGCWR
eukprot:2412708-Amphidinium_carterae.1